MSGLVPQKQIDYKVGSLVIRLRTKLGRLLSGLASLLPAIFFTHPASAQSHFIARPAEAGAYEPYLDATRDIASQFSAKSKLTMEAVEKWTRRASRFRYERVGELPLKKPEQVEADGSGDCKDKSLWLFSKLREAGAMELRLVVGKRWIAGNTYHAWLYLDFEGKTYLLDPAETGAVWEPADFSRSEYLPYFGFDGIQAYAYELRPAAPK